MFYRLLSVLAAVACASAENTSVSNRNETTTPQPTKKVKLDVYYESLCPDSIALYRSELVPVMKQLNQYVDLRTFPYGKALTAVHNGTITFKCQHGAKECYGNKLHACAIDQLTSGHPSWLSFNDCLMSAQSNDEAADQCARFLKTDSEPIKACAKGDKGTQLLKHYGEESAKVKYSYIPHVVIDGSPMNKNTKLMKAVCSAIKISPPVCTKY